MILIALRIVFGAALAYGFSKVWQNEQTAPQTGDLVNAFYLAVCVILAMANAVVWAPYFGDRVSGPLTGVMTTGTYVDRKNLLLSLIHWLERRRLRRLTRWFCFLEGVHHPERPAAFVIGLKHATKGSWLEKVYALELFRFDNAQNCLLAYEALRRHRIDPRPHHNPGVNMLLLSLEREARPTPEPVPVPSAPPAAALKRDRRIKLFDMDAPAAAAADPARGSDTGQEEASAPTDAPAVEPVEIEPGQGEEGRPDEPAAVTGEETTGFVGRIRALFR
jgi:hypothetical protein